jgi:hypothetical protein
MVIKGKNEELLVKQLKTCEKKMQDKWDFIKLKSFCSTNKMVSKLKRTPTEWEKIFARYTSKD